MFYLTCANRLPNGRTAKPVSKSVEPRGILHRVPEVLVRARGLTKRFGDFTAVDGIDFDLIRGEAFGFLGPNGAGKSSTMRMLGCVSPHTHGELTILGGDPVRDGAAIRARLGVVPQEDTLDSELSVRENLLVYGRYFGLPRKLISARTDQLLDFVQLTERADDQVEPLSGGMKRRLTIARSLINDPDILILDEPTTGLDPQARHVVWDRLFRLKQRGVTLILTTHYMDEAEQLCDRLVVMDHGKIAAEGTPRDLIAKYSTPEVLELRFAPEHWDEAVLKVKELQERMSAPDTMAAAIGRAPGGYGGSSPREMTVLTADRMLLYAADGDEFLARVHAAGIDPLTELVRRSTLEDVFLHLTGRTLID
jgi:lipooligosaccharide transport system ATP-binding protein